MLRHMCMLVWVCTYMCVDVLACVSVCRPEVDAGSLSQLLSTVFWGAIGLFSEPGLHGFCPLTLPPQSWGDRHVLPCLGVYIGSRDPDSVLILHSRHFTKGHISSALILICFFVCMCVRVCACACGSQRTTSDAIYLSVS